MNTIIGFSKYRIDKVGNVHNQRLRQQVDADGYHCVTLVNDCGKKVRKFVHRLVLGTYKPTDDITLVVDHINRCRSDNRIENLRWATRKENRKMSALWQRC